MSERNGHQPELVDQALREKNEKNKYKKCSATNVPRHAMWYPEQIKEKQKKSKRKKEIKVKNMANAA